VLDLRCGSGRDVLTCAPSLVGRPARGGDRQTPSSWSGRPIPISTPSARATAKLLFLEGTLGPLASCPWPPRFESGEFPTVWLNLCTDKAGRGLAGVRRLLKPVASFYFAVSTPIGALKKTPPPPSAAP